MLEAPQTRRVVETNARSTSGVHNINSEELAALAIPCPSLEEQEEVVKRIRAAMDWLNPVRIERDRAEQLLDHLDQAILSEAFRGELVPQNPNDEPAEKLLERVRAACQLGILPSSKLAATVEVFCRSARIKSPRNGAPLHRGRAPNQERTVRGRRTGFNPKTQQKIRIPAKTVLKFPSRQSGKAHSSWSKKSS